MEVNHNRWWRNKGKMVAGVSKQESKHRVCLPLSWLYYTCNKDYAYVKLNIVSDGASRDEVDTWKLDYFVCHLESILTWGVVLFFFSSITLVLLPSKFYRCYGIYCMQRFVSFINQRLILITNIIVRFYGEKYIKLDILDVIKHCSQLLKVTISSLVLHAHWNSYSIYFKHLKFN